MPGYGGRHARPRSGRGRGGEREHDLEGFRTAHIEQVEAASDVRLDELCACGEHGCLATIASGRALLRRLAPHGIETLDDLARAAGDGHKPTVDALREGGRAVGVVLSGVATMIDPGAILFGGPLGPLPPFLDAVRGEIKHLTYARTAKGIEVGPTVLGQLSGVTGLAGLIVDAHLDAAGVDRMVAAAGSGERLPRRSPAAAR
jgi:predicted NBD/HSP70 family sugar kinase